MAHIFIIVGETGEYDDMRTWNVGAFLDGISCSNYLHKLNQYLTENNIPLDRFERADNPEKPFLDSKLKNEWQNQGVEYHVETLEIYDNK